jgi:peptidoglycan hydrolase FlgJ
MAAAAQSPQAIFVQTYWQDAAKAGAKYGHHPAFILAHAVAEKGWTGSKISKQANNFFGITAGRSWTGPTYLATTGLTFRAYPHFQASMEDYLALLYNPKGYYTKVIKQGTIEEFAATIAASPYIAEVNGDNRENYRRNILSAYYQIIALQPTNTNWLLVGLGLAAAAGAGWYLWHYAPQAKQTIRRLLTT